MSLVTSLEVIGAIFLVLWDGFMGVAVDGLVEIAGFAVVAIVDGLSVVGLAIVAFFETGSTFAADGLVLGSEAGLVTGLIFALAGLASVSGFLTMAVLGLEIVFITIYDYCGVVAYLAS